MLNNSQSFSNKSKMISRRIFIFSIIKFAVFFGIIGRLFYLQISENLKYKSLSDKNRLREWKVIPQRGTIEDYFGNKMASNKQVFQLHMMPEDVPNIEELFFKLSRLIEFNKQEKTSLIKRLKKRKPWQPIIVSENLSWAEFSRLNLFVHEIPGIKPVVAVARKYIEDGSLAHLVGYVSSVSAKDLQKNKYLRSINVPGLKTGKSGLEKSLNRSIIGKPGFQRFEVNAYGKRVKELKFTQGTFGKNYKTTIDIEIQKYASKLIADKSGSVCVMDIYTGDIIAMVSAPTFDPNQFVHGISLDNWKALIEDKKKPLLNKSLSGLYPPGSTIKPIVALSALENNIVSPKFVVDCKGSIDFYEKRYHCWKEKGHGLMGLRNAIKQSCDVYFYEIARRLGIDRMSETAKKFGFGKKAFDIFNEEKAGVVPSTKWKLKNIGKNWYLGETLISGIGQGYFQTTPMQLCLMTAQLANGGYKIEPRIIDDRNEIQSTINAWRKEFNIRNNNLDTPNPELEKLFTNKENVKFVLDALYGATNEPMGTSYGSRLTKSGYIFAGKTGTSQVRTISEEQRKLKLKNKDLEYKNRDHALFTAFAPYKKPRYAISVIIEHGGSGSSGAAPIAKKLIKKILDRHELRQKYQLDLFQDI
jgi:penicillin-binding protein 2